MKSSFQEQCFRAALHTISLDPLQILRDATRIPDNILAEEGRTAKPTWIGRNYMPGGVLLLGKNPGGGSPSFATARPSLDIESFTALQMLWNRRDFAAYAHWRDHAQPQAMKQWPFWLSISAVLETFRCDMHQVAIGNFVPFRSRENRIYADEFRNAWQLDLGRVVALLQPVLIVKMTSGFSAFQHLCPDGIAVRQFHRANGDKYITAAGEKDLEALQRLRQLESVEKAGRSSWFQTRKATSHG